MLTAGLTRGDREGPHTKARLLSPSEQAFACLFWWLWETAGDFDHAPEVRYTWLISAEHHVCASRCLIPYRLHEFDVGLAVAIVDQSLSCMASETRNLIARMTFRKNIPMPRGGWFCFCSNQRLRKQGTGKVNSSF